MPARILCGSVCMLFLFVAMSSCNEQDSDNATIAQSDLTPDLPAKRYQYYNSLDPNNAKSTLGRVLFYDKALSAGNTISCGSCHQQAAAFADNHKLSRGVAGNTVRNVMAIQNIPSLNPPLPKGFNGYYAGSNGPRPGNFFWDGRENSLEKLVLQPIMNPVEMGVKDVNTLVRKVTEQPYYQRLFMDAYGTTNITDYRIANALGLFLTSIKSAHTKFDRYTEGSVQLTPLEFEGMGLFQTKYDCNRCHFIEQKELDAKFANIGLEDIYKDKGLSGTTLNSFDDGKFKIPSLRNVQYTAPYMHDGSYPALDNVIEHYSHGIARTPNLDTDLAVPMSGGYPRHMNISQHEKEAIIAFLYTLSDDTFKDPKFSDPFVTIQ